MTATKPPVSIVVAALVPKLGIGYKGTLPWKLKQEMKYFRQVTTTTSTPEKSNVVIMGRKTWESIPLKFRPLPNRVNVVLTRDPSRLSLELNNELISNNKESLNLLVSRSVQDSIDEISSKIGLHKIENIFIIGGAEIYNDCITQGIVDQILLTEVTTEIECPVDTFLKIAIYDQEQWIEGDLKSYLNKRNITGFEINNQEGDFKYKFSLFNKK